MHAGERWQESAAVTNRAMRDESNKSGEAEPKAESAEHFTSDQGEQRGYSHKNSSATHRNM